MSWDASPDDRDPLARRSRALQDLTLDLAVAREPAEVCDVASRHVLLALAASGAAAWYLDSARGVQLGAAVGDLAGRPLATPDLAAFAVSSRADPYQAEPWATQAFSGLMREHASDRIRTATLTAGGQVVGGLVVTTVAEAGADEDLRLFATIVRTAGEALGRSVVMSDVLRLAAIVNASDDAMIQTGVDGTVVSWNPAAERVLGFTAQEAVGQHFSVFIPAGVDDTPMSAARARVLAGAGPEQLLVRRRHKHGHVVPLMLTLTAVRDDAGNVTALAVIARDLTDRLVAEERMRRLAAVVDGAPLAVIVVEPDGSVAECNRGAEAMLQRSRGDLLGRRLASFGTAGEHLGDLFARALSGETVDAATIDLADDDGRHLKIQVGAFPVGNGPRDVNAVALIGLDVTESAAVADALQRARSLEALGRLAGGVAHDINNILAIIDASMSIARDPLEDEDARREALDEVTAASARAGRLVRQLLTFARRQPVSAERTDVYAVVSELAPMLTSLIGPAIRLAIGGEPGRSIVRADLAGLEQIVVNLVLNARDAMPDGGRLSVAVAPIGDSAVLTVTDTGEGMSEAVAARIFEPFFTTKAPGADRGSGLGLAAVHGAVEQAGGTIAVASAPGEGTTFTVRLPLERRQPVPPPAAPDGERPAPVPDGTRGGRRVLLCDDEPALLRLTTRMLERAGYEVTAFVDPREALTALTDDVELLITDVQMPHLSGPELARQMPPGLPVVLLSGFAPAGLDLERATLLDKPFTRETLLAAVHEALARADGSTRA